MRAVWLAVVATVVVHLSLTLGANSWSIGDSDGGPEQSEPQYAEVSLSEDSPALNADDPLSVGGQSHMNQKVANLKANDAARLSSEHRSSGSERQITQGTDQELREQVMQELRALEQEEFERLAAEKKEFETAGQADITSQEVGQTFDGWDHQYDGLVTVKFRLEGRSGRDLDVPGYTCEGKAQIEVRIVVDAGGAVTKASLVNGDPESCFGQAALRSARRARFNASSSAPNAQAGSITYVFVAQ